MHINRILKQHRRDFYAIYECEHCGFKKKACGYDDDNFHQNVIPKVPCDNCGELAGENYRPLTTKYPANLVI